MFLSVPFQSKGHVILNVMLWDWKVRISVVPGSSSNSPQYVIEGREKRKEAYLSFIYFLCATEKRLSILITPWFRESANKHSIWNIRYWKRRAAGTKRRQSRQKQTKKWPRSESTDRETLFRICFWSLRECKRQGSPSVMMSDHG